MERVSTGSNTIQKSKEDRRSIKMAFKIVRNDITKMNTEAIVNTANDHPTVGIGCDSAVYGDTFVRCIRW